MSSAPTKNPVLSHSQAADKSQDTRERDLLAASIGDRYTVLNRIGAYGDTSLYLARDRRSRQEVTLKALSDSAAHDTLKVKLFYLESRAAAKLSHDNILKSTEAARFGSFHFSVIEHKPRVETLRKLLDQRGWLDIDQATSIARQIIFALEHAHTNDVMHLRLRPEDVLINPDGMAILTGFGIESDSEMAWAHKERTRLCPTRYISPEQINDSNIDYRADLYALGVILFEMLTDRAPFESPEPEQVRQRHLTRPPQPPAVYREDIPEALSDLVMDLLEKNPDERIRKISSYRSLLSRLFNARFDTDTATVQSVEATPSGSPASDFLLFNQPQDELMVIEAELVTQTEIDSSEAGYTEAMIPLYESYSFDKDSIPDDHSLIRVHKREPFEPPTISAMDMQFDQNYDCTPPVEVSQREPEALIDSSSALTVRSAMPMLIEKVGKASRAKRALIGLAGVLLLLLLIALIQKSQSSTDLQNPSTPATESNIDSTNGAASATQPQNQNNSLTRTDRSSSNQQGSKAVKPARNSSSIRRSGPLRRVRRSQPRARRSASTQRLRRQRR